MAANILNPWSASKIPSLAGKVAVITGGNEGIGAAFTTELLKNGLSKVFIASNDPLRHDDAVKHFSKEVGSDVSDKVVFHKMDLGDYTSVRKAVDEIKKATDRVDILNCNAAIGMYKPDVPSSTTEKTYGLDRHFACNNVGHAILTQGLLPLIKQTGAKTQDARIVILASNLHFSCDSSTKFASVDELNRELGPTLQYNRSKMGNVLYAKRLARDFQSEGISHQVFINSVHPGVVKTAQQDGALETYENIIKNTVGDGVVGQAASAALGAANYTARELMMKDTPEGALSSLFAATSPEVKEKGLNGEYIVPNGHTQQADKRALDTNYQDACWNVIQECIEKDVGNVKGFDHAQDDTSRGSATI